MRSLGKGTYRLVTGALLTSILLLLSALAPAQNEENAEVSRLLSDAKEKASARVTLGLYRNCSAEMV